MSETRQFIIFIMMLATMVAAVTTMIRIDIQRTCAPTLWEHSQKGSTHD